uniref:Putative RxLR effector n=1 Tax=Plasmopara viticola TaxID=143451 RepID=A0A650F578_PLAVT|nr:putative RxLR effector [Plasmopara viticola]
MRGAHYVTTALLVVASSQASAGFDQAEPQQAPHNDGVGSGGNVNKLLPRHVLRESPNAKDTLTVDAGSEERMMRHFSNKIDFSKELDQNVISSASKIRTGADDVIAEATEAIRRYKQLKPVFKALHSKRKRIDPTPNNVGRQALHTPNIETPLVPVGNIASFASAKNLEKIKPNVDMQKTARIMAQHDHRPAPPGSFTFKAAVPDSRPNKLLRAQKVLEFDLNKYPDEVEIRNSKRQRINHMHDSVGGHAPHALPNPENSRVSLENNPTKSLMPLTKNAGTVLTERLGRYTSKVIVENAINSVAEHNLQHKRLVSSTTIAADPGGQLNKQLIAQKALEFGNIKYPDKVNSHSVNHPLHLLEGNEKSAHPAATKGQSVPIDWKAEIAEGPDVGPKVVVDDKVKGIHEAFLKAFSLPFHQYPQETAKMLRPLTWKVNSSPNTGVLLQTLNFLATSQKQDVSKRVLGPDMKKLLGTGESALQATKVNLDAAYTAKLAIMYELFYEFCHGGGIVIDKLPSKVKSQQSIFEH